MITGFYPSLDERWGSGHHHCDALASHFVENNLPTLVDPVKLSLRTSGFEVISRPMLSASPVNTENTHFGTPARSARTTSAKAENGA
jgi:hypothetical protein